MPKMFFKNVFKDGISTVKQSFKNRMKARTGALKIV